MEAHRPDAVRDLTARPTIELDHHGADYRDRWQEISDGNVASCPVAHTAAYGGTWVVSGYEPLVEALRDHSRVLLVPGPHRPGRADARAPATRRSRP